MATRSKQTKVVQLQRLSGETPNGEAIVRTYDKIKHRNQAEMTQSHQKWWGNSKLHVNAPLTNISIAYRNPVYVADQVFPLVRVNKQSDIYIVYTKADWFRDEAARRAPGEEAKRSGWNVDKTNTFYCDNFALGKDIPDEVRAGADSLYNLDREATMFVTDRLQLQRDVKWAADFFTTSVWGTTVTGNSNFTYWDTYASSDPISDVHDGIETILNNTGKVPNTLLLGYQVYNELQDHPDFLDRIKYTQTGIVTEDLMARVFGVDRVIVARPIYTTNLQLNTDETYSFIFGKNALLAYVAPQPSRMEPSAGYTFWWDGGFGGNNIQVISSRRDTARHTDVVEGFTWYDSKAVATDVGLKSSPILQ